MLEDSSKRRQTTTYDDSLGTKCTNRDCSLSHQPSCCHDFKGLEPAISHHSEVKDERN